MTEWANFLFYGNLNDFLRPRERNTCIRYNFSGAPAVKDAIEAIGIPHPEVDRILINNTPVVFFQPLHPHDQVEVYPAWHRLLHAETYSLQAQLAPANGFVLDVHLGKLARSLRLLGFNTCYQNNYTDKEIAEIAARDNRRVLTRDVGLLKQKKINWGYWLRSQHTQEQLTEVLAYFNLKRQLAPFTRCLECNGELTTVTKESVWELLPPKTRLFFNQFYQCPNCRRVYWQGSHFERMQEFVTHISKA
ncbi:hypothetical protein AAE02nite_05110 [Adhaeribacter aerolatus]|uniref:Twitching motility protein PilT n=1 Tax=Adhaeribacter aerolatus TaxID=670289 RepID=A0A512ATD2_9BACT|nr:Mut7-C RNAse domain-containing protein [Adhaeribacter aerolatus]GEO02847.1 hypothetical protein AAE02nite_05110 [Adhaeribacter aerolatus]